MMIFDGGFTMMIFGKETLVMILNLVQLMMNLDKMTFD